MKYGSLSKNKYTSNLTNSKNMKPKEIKDIQIKSKSTITSEKESSKPHMNTFRPGIISRDTTTNKFKTTKNSRKNIVNIS